MLWGPAELVVGEIVLIVGNGRVVAAATQQSWGSNRNAKMEKITSFTLFMVAPFNRSGATPKKNGDFEPQFSNPAILR